VYVCTVNDYLAKRDFEQMRPVLIALGLTVGLVTGDLQTASPERRKAYFCDVTYCTGQVCRCECLVVWHSCVVRLPVARSNGRSACLFKRSGSQEMAFDYLRDNLAENPTAVVLRTNFYFAVIDEADALLIDECKNPMIISNAEVCIPYPIHESS
jgi:preprotein translocase subunit SecA